MNIKIEGKTLIITLDLFQQPEPSSTGKTLIVASTGGNQKTELKINGKTVTVGANAYIKP